MTNLYSLQFICCVQQPCLAIQNKRKNRPNASMYVSIHTHTHTLPLPLPQSKQAINKSTKGSQRLNHIYKRFHDHIGITLQNTLVNTNFQGKLQGLSSSYCFPLIYLIAQFDKILIIYFNIHKICSYSIQYTRNYLIQNIYSQKMDQQICEPTTCERLY